jgi:hypothetical protein
MIVGISGKIGSGKDTLAAMIQYHAFTSSRSHTWNLQMFLNSTPEQREILGHWKIRRFAGALKQIVALLTGCNVEDFESQEFKNQELPSMWDRSLDDAREFLQFKCRHSGTALYLDDLDWVRRQATDMGFKFSRTYREVLQEIGTNVMRRHFLDNVWINALFSTYEPHSTHWTNDDLPDWLIPDVRFPNEAKAIHERGGILVRINRYPKEDTFQYTTGPNIPAQHSSETALDNYKGFDVVIDNTGTLEDLYNKVTDLVTQFKLQTHHERKGATASRTTTTDASAGTGT